MYAEISMQIQERGGKPNKTEVVTLNAEIADVVTEGDMVIASVRFSGMIREEANAPAEAFSEIWHIQKSQSQTNATWFISFTVLRFDILRFCGSQFPFLFRFGAVLSSLSSRS